MPTHRPALRGARLPDLMLPESFERPQFPCRLVHGEELRGAAARQSRLPSGQNKVGEATDAGQTKQRGQKRWQKAEHDRAKIQSDRASDDQ